jgi:ornithine cyclodeaminase/alanine dehydrogenase
MAEIIYLSEADLIALGITTRDVVECIESAIRGAEAGRVWSAPKAVIVPPDDGRYMMAALAAMDNPSLLAVKTVVLNPENPQRGLPQINGLVTMLDSSSGLPVAILDGNWITEVRTAGLSAVAACRLANPGAQSVGFVGCGAQARSHLQAFADLFPLKSIKLFGRGQANQDRLASAAADLGLSIEVCATGQDVVADVDLVVTSITATGGSEPFLDARGLKPGAFAAITDLGVPWIRDSFGALDRVVIDDLEQEAALPDKLCDPAFISGDLSGLVLGKIDGRTAHDERAAFLFRGHALGDLALSVLALGKYREGQG